MSRQTTDKQHFYKVSDSEKGKSHIATSDAHHTVAPIMDKKAVANLEHNAERSPDNRLVGKGENSPDDKLVCNVDDISMHSAGCII